LVRVRDRVQTRSSNGLDWLGLGVRCNICHNAPSACSRRILPMSTNTDVHICYILTYNSKVNRKRLITGSDRRPEIKQEIQGKIDRPRFRSGRIRVRVRDRVRVSYN